MVYEHKRNVWETLQCPEYVLKCNKSVNLPTNFMIPRTRVGRLVGRHFTNTCILNDIFLMSFGRLSGDFSTIWAGSAPLT